MAGKGSARDGSPCIGSGSGGKAGKHGVGILLHKSCDILMKKP